MNTYERAREIAKRNYETENGNNTWELLDKYTREDNVYAEYKKLEKENKAMNRTERTEVLKNNGVNTDGFFNVNLQVPFGKKIEIMVDGKPVDLSNIKETENNELWKEVAEDIENKGCVKNNKLWRRWVMAQTFRMLKFGWSDYMRTKFTYKYQFDMLRDELHAQSRMYKEGAIDDYKERNQFFNKDVVIALCEDYVKKLRKEYKEKYNAERRKKKNRNKEVYVYVPIYGDVRESDFEEKIISRLEQRIENIKYTGRHRVSELENQFNMFSVIASTRLKPTTSKCAVWKTAYKASGAYFSLKNMILFHDVVLEGCNNMSESIEELKAKANEYAGKEGWRLHAFMKKTIADNKFDFYEAMNAKYED